MLSSFQNMNASEKRFALVASLLMLGYFLLQWKNGRDQMYDFQVYYGAASQLMNGETPYGQAFGVSSGIYKYSPIALLIFMPFALLPYKLASSLFFFLIAGTLVYVMTHLFRLTEKMFTHSPYSGWAMVLITLVLSDVFGRELHLGNINLLLLGLFLLAYRQMSKRRSRLSGLLMGLGILFKPHFVIVIPWLIVRKEWSSALWLGIGILGGLLIPAISLGWTGNMNLLEDWYGALTIHNVDLVDSPNTLFGIINTFVLNPIGIQVGKIFPLVVIGITGLVYLWWLNRHGWKDVQPKDKFLEFAVLLALIPSLAHTDTEHFLLAAPLMVLLVGGIFTLEKFKWVLAIAFALCTIPWYLNTPDIIGATATEFMDLSGVLGMSSFLVVISAILMTQNLD
jgi:alpha-1,2-mannosyltransferase